jgi:hypothetical protein
MVIAYDYNPRNIRVLAFYKAEAMGGSKHKVLIN